MSSSLISAIAAAEPAKSSSTGDVLDFAAATAFALSVRAASMRPDKGRLGTASTSIRCSSTGSGAGAGFPNTFGAADLSLRLFAAVAAWRAAQRAGR